MNNIIVILIVLLLIFYFDYKFNDLNFFKKDIKKFNFKEFLKYLLLFLVIVLGLYFIFIKLDLVSFNKLNKINLTNIIYLGILIPFIEEYVFRYLPIKKIKVNKYVLLLITSILFTFYHYQGIYESIIIFVSGCLLFNMYIKTDKVLNNILSHSFYNLIILLMSLL